MATMTVTELVTSTVTATGTGTPSSTARAAPQAGIIEGSNPTDYDPKNPIIVFIIQAGIIIIFCRLLHWPLSKLRQPRVIAEVIGGILLGPSVMGRIPGFKDTIFPSDSMPALTLVANLGLVLFLFLVGLEVDLRFLISNWRIALSVGAAGMALPFGLGCAIAWGLFNTFRDEPNTVPIDFPVFMLFIGVALAITAFPVLCRILTELKLLSTPVGVIVLSAGVGNDVVGWILLALCVALVNAGTGISALWVLLTAIAFTLFMAFGVRPTFMLILKRTRSLQDGPSQGIIVLTLLIALSSAFFTAVIGVHPIFGAFIAGLICPHEGGFAIKVTEKIEDLISALFLPLYFALSGLSTDLGLLDDGRTWGYVFGVIFTAFFAKVIGGSVAARFNGLVWRECFTIGALMSCKGLVELIVLNIGLQAKILSVRTFTIFVVMAVVTTFATTPLVTALYPPWYQQKLEAWKRGEIDWEKGERHDSSDDSGDHDAIALEKQDATQVKKMLMHVRLDVMPGLLAFVAVCGGANEGAVSGRVSQSTATSKLDTRPISAHGVRLLQLTDRESSVMQVSEVDEYSELDPVVNTLRTFGRLHNVAISGEVAISPESSFSETLVTRARETSSDLLLLPWSESGSMSESRIVTSDDNRMKLTSGPYQEFVSNAMRSADSHVAVLIDQGFGGSHQQKKRKLARTYSAISMQDHPPPSHTTVLPKQRHRIFLPFFGTHDDQVSARMVLQFANDPRVSIQLFHVRCDFDEEQPASHVMIDRSRSRESKPPTVSIPRNLDSIERQTAFLDTLRASLPSDSASRVACEVFDCSNSSRAATTQQISKTLSEQADRTGDLVVVGRNASSDADSCLGTLADALLGDGCKASILVLQGNR